MKYRIHWWNLVKILLLFVLCSVFFYAWISSEPNLDDLLFPSKVDLFAVRNQLLATNSVQHHLPSPLNSITFKLLLGNKIRCLSKNSPTQNTPDLIFLVKTKPDLFERRQIIRRTWANKSHFKSCGLSVRTLFIMGRLHKSSAKLERLQDMLEQESRNLQDIVQFDFIDSFENIPYKLMASFEFIIRYCSGVKFVTVVDDDFLIHPKNLVRTVLKVKGSQYLTYIQGRIYVRDEVKRDPMSKWYVSEAQYPFPYYPPFPCGGTIILSLPMVRVISVGFRYAKLLFIDDVMIGIILWKLNLAPIHSPHIYVWDAWENRRLATMISAHYYGNIDHLLEDWEKIKDDVSCKSLWTK
ncbi:unnamed protein product [Calicophoron daubneyi]|uniref:Hexosyltransferase n=1 Tax=Calicophoron daubneyi TaxID=300641 RepID=A0AAV2TAW3_CALDB